MFINICFRDVVEKIQCCPHYNNKKNQINTFLKVYLHLTSRKIFIEITGSQVSRLRFSPAKDYVYQTEIFIVRVGLYF